VRSYHRIIVIFFVTAFLEYIVSSDLPTVMAQENRWLQMSDLNTPHQFHTAVTIDAKIYVLGGSQYNYREPSECRYTHLLIQ